MRNGIRSNKLTLVNSMGLAVSEDEDDLQTVPDAQAVSLSQSGLEEEQSDIIRPVLILLTVSLTCATAAVAAGSYALWLSRHRAARQTLTDVQDILKRCQDRMHQMEDDLLNLPGGVTSMQT